MYIINLALVLTAIAAVNCTTKRILIVSDDGSNETVKVIKSLNSGDCNYEELSKSSATKMPSLINKQTEQPNYHTIYSLKSTWNADWGVEQVAAYLQKGGNLLTVASGEAERILNDLGLDMVRGTIVGGKGQWNPQHSFSSFVDGINVPKEESTAFKLRNDVKKSDFNPLIQSALTLAPGSAICPSGKKCISSSQSVSMLATLESRTGSRFMAVTSSALLNSLSEEAKKGMFEWLQGTKFTLKIASISHQLSSGDVANRGRTDLDSTIYRVKDRINVRMCLTGGNSAARFIPNDPADFQFELKMMNIQVRKSFDSIDGDGCLNVRDIQLPSKSAVYTLQVFYNRAGWTQLSHTERLLVRPYRHDEFERFLPVALPYYASWLGLLIASYLILLPTILKASK